MSASVLIIDLRVTEKIKILPIKRAKVFLTTKKSFRKGMSN
jgi:hypothetical protein